MENPSNYFEVHLNSNDNLITENSIVSAGNFNAGDAQSINITNIASTASMRVGMFIADTDNTYIPAGTTIASIVSNTAITLSVQTNAGNAAVARAFTVRNLDNSKCIFNIGSVLDQTPNAQELENETECLIKINYFNIERTSAEFTTANVNIIQIRSNIILPNTVESQPAREGYNNMGSSNILGVIPVGNTTFTYSDFQTNPNVYKSSANLFKGQIEINLTDQDGTPLTILQHKEWYMIMCIYFPKTNKINNLNMPKII